MTEPVKPTILVAGATGFVGSPLVERLAREYKVIALSRSARTSSENVEWRECDLLSCRAATEAVAGADLAIYLVHSMLPSDHLVQGDFEDFDLHAADNFARACAANGIRQIVYLGGLLPQNVPTERLSRHLRSRAEVEVALGGTGIPVTVLRAGLILGPGGSSLEIMLRLAKRLPAMVCPRWTNTPTHPIALDDVLELIPWVLGREQTFGEIYDIGGPEVMTYRTLMLLAAKELGRHPPTFSVPILTPTLSRLWISLVTGAPKALAAPLVESLSHEMVARDRRLQEQAGVPGRPFAAAIRESIDDDPAAAPRAFRRADNEELPVVRSVQRFTGTSLEVEQVATEYPRWLESKASPLLRIDGDAAHSWSIHLLSTKGTNMLGFEIDEESSSASRVVFAITGGLLAKPGVVGRFEFRSVLGDGTVLCSVHAFTPRLWWPLYVATQARLHLLVMNAFSRHLRRSYPRGPRGSLKSAETA